MIVKSQKPIKFINGCNCKVDYNLLEKAILWFSDKPVTCNKHIYIYGRYPAVSIYKDKIHIHRLITMYLLKKAIAKNIIVHHSDGNRLNCLSNNLEVMKGSLHAHLHNFGKVLSESHKKKIGLANSKRRGIRLKKRVSIDLQVLQTMLADRKSINSIAKFFKVDWSTIKNRINENPELLIKPTL